jgi:hypothetical protein
MGRRDDEEIDVERLRAAVRGIVESGRFDDWLAEVPDEVLVQVAAPMEVLTFHYYLDPPRDRHLVRAARVACASVAGSLARCPHDMAGAFRGLSDALTSTPAADPG